MATPFASSRFSFLVEESRGAEQRRHPRVSADLLRLFRTGAGISGFP
jgi:hypothetical protein